MKLRLNVELLREVAGRETVRVVGSPPILDVGSSVVGTTVNSDFVRNLAVSRPDEPGGASRSFDSLAATPSTSNDVYGVAISCSSSPENSYLIDGSSVNDPPCGVNSSPLTDSPDAILGARCLDDVRDMRATLNQPRPRGRLREGGSGDERPHRGSEPGNLLNHQAVLRVEVRSAAFF